jgi:hypothetical protein
MSIFVSIAVEALKSVVGKATEAVLEARRRLVPKNPEQSLNYLVVSGSFVPLAAKVTNSRGRTCTTNAYGYVEDPPGDWARELRTGDLWLAVHLDGGRVHVVRPEVYGGLVLVVVPVP